MKYKVHIQILLFKFTYCFLVVLLFHSKILGKTIEARSGRSEDIKSAIDISQSTDTIRIPEGIFPFDGSIICSAGIQVIGAGYKKTVLKRNDSTTSPFITINGMNDQPFLISGISFIGDTSPTSKREDWGIRFIGNCKKFRVTDCSFSHIGIAAIDVRGTSNGVVDQCFFNKIYRDSIGNYGYAVLVCGTGDTSWNFPLLLGTGDAVFVEDCHFTLCRHAISSNQGSRYVFRFNKCIDNAAKNPAIDAHGLEYGSTRGSRSYEIYNNLIDNKESSHAWCGICIRGGDGVIFNNTLVKGTEIPIILANASGKDTIYPAKDQIRDLYIWNNTYMGNSTTAKVLPEYGHYNMILQNRDYFNFAKPNYLPYHYPHPLRNTSTTSQESTNHKHEQSLKILKNSNLLVYVNKNYRFSLYIYDIMGRVHLKKNIFPNNTSTHSFAVPKTTGVYIVVLQQNNVTLSNKIIITN
ncbi:MAG: right-handed parallel beta-helix repeat-containing protein [Fibrobacteres bacterium]|nr:right-handed parallel beta-helix repeat-containing protein [Fibrobacterota bacterium]